VGTDRRVLLIVLMIVAGAAAVTIAAPPPAVSAGIGCVGPCHAETSFSPTQVGTAIRTQMTCGSGFTDAQNSQGLRLTNHGTDPTTCDQILPAANAPGSQGMGFRHLRDYPGLGGGIKFIFAPLSDISVSFRMLYSRGFQYSGGTPGFTKETYGNGTIIFGHQGGAWGVNVGGGTNYPGSKNWTQTMGGTAGDGVFHCYEYRLNFAARTMEVWVDEQKTLDRVNVDYKGTTQYDNFHISNQSAITVGGWTDYDDFRIDTGLPTGAQIGCSGGGSGGQAPGAPSNLRITRLWDRTPAGTIANLAFALFGRT
jgi:hypothetical protein